VLSSANLKFLQQGLFSPSSPPTGQSLGVCLPLIAQLYSAPSLFLSLALSLSTEQPLFVSASFFDHSLRVFNYVHRSVEVAEVFEKPPVCVSFHPSAALLLVGFPDIVTMFRGLHPALCSQVCFLSFHINLFRSFSVTPSRLEPRAHLSLGFPSHLAFSHSGAIFALACNRVIYIYATNTLKNTFQFHSHRGEIVDLAFARMFFILWEVKNAISLLYLSIIFVFFFPSSLHVSCS